MLHMLTIAELPQDRELTQRYCAFHEVLLKYAVIFVEICRDIYELFMFLRTSTSTATSKRDTW